MYCKLTTLILVTFISLCFCRTIVGLECYNSLCNSDKIGACINTTVSKRTTVVSCAGSCQMRYISNQALASEILQRACMLSCQQAFGEAADGSVEITSCCEDVLCNTDLPGTSAMTTGGSRCYSCAGASQTGVCGEQAVPETPYGPVHIKTCNHGCLFEYERSGEMKRYMRRCLDKGETCTNSRTTSDTRDGVTQCCTGDLCNARQRDEDEEGGFTNTTSTGEHRTGRYWHLSSMALLGHGIVWLYN